MTREYKIISADSHLDLSPDRWRQRVPAKWRDHAPKVIRLASGADAVVMEGGRTRQISVLSHGGVTREEIHKQIPTFENSAGCGTPEQRLMEQDQDGVDAEVLFSAVGNTDLLGQVKDDEAHVALVHAYNEYLAEEYASVAPDRLMPMGVIPTCGINAALAELEYCADAGMKGVEISRFPSGKGIPTPEDDRFWAAALDLEMALTHHCGTGSTRMARADEPTFDYKTLGDRLGLGDRGPDPMRGWFFRYAFEGVVAPVQMAFAGVWDRFPDLQIYWGETLIGWLPATLVQVDSNYERYKYVARDAYGMEFPEFPLSHYIKKHSLWGFLSDPYGVETRHIPGVEHVMWGSDFAHAAGDWPESRKQIEREFAEVPEDEKYLMLTGNAIRFFHLDDQ